MKNREIVTGELAHCTHLLATTMTSSNVGQNVDSTEMFTETDPMKAPL